MPDEQANNEQGGQPVLDCRSEIDDMIAAHRMRNKNTKCKRKLAHCSTYQKGSESTAR